MLTAKKFANILQSIRKADDEFRGLVAEALAFSIYHARNHGQKTPFLDLCKAVPGWLQKDISKVPMGKHKLSEDAATHEADALVAVWFQSHAERKAAAKDQREARKALQGEVAPKEEKLTKTVAEFCLLMGEDSYDLTENEASALLDTLLAIRSIKVDPLKLAA